MSGESLSELVLVVKLISETCCMVCTVMYEWCNVNGTFCNFFLLGKFIEFCWLDDDAMVYEWIKLLFLLPFCLFVLKCRLLCWHGVKWKGKKNWWCMIIWYVWYAMAFTWNEIFLWFWQFVFYVLKYWLVLTLKKRKRNEN